MAEEGGGGKSSRHAFVTMVTSDDFVIGAEALFASLKATGTRKEFAVMVTEGVTKYKRKVLANLAVLIDVPTLLIPNARNLISSEPGAAAEAAHKGSADGEEGDEQHQGHPSPPPSHVASWGKVGYTKLAVWGLSQFTKVVYVDADCLVRENIDDLFDWAGDTPGSFAAAPDVFPPDRFNAGVMVVVPDTSLLETMKSQVEALPTYDGGDTGFLNAFFPRWFQGPAECRLPFAFNAQRTLHWMTFEKNPGYWEACKPIKIIHYCSSPKPWEDVNRKGSLELLWWEAFTQNKMAQLMMGT